MNKRRIEIAPSILAADFRRLERALKSVQDGSADRIHFDIMDGVFGSNNYRSAIECLKNSGRGIIR